MKTPYVTISNYDPAKHGHYERNTLKSMTIPDQSLTIREILERHVNGTLDNELYRAADDGWDEDDPRTEDDFDPSSDPTFDLVDAQNLLAWFNERKRLREAENAKQVESIEAVEDDKAKQSQAKDVEINEGEAAVTAV